MGVARFHPTAKDTRRSDSLRGLSRSQDRNGDEYLDACISQIYDFADEIVIAEGATESWMKAMGWDSPESRDRTLEILETWKVIDKGRKIKIVSDGWKNKDDQSNGYMKLLSPDVDYIWHLDSDEFYVKDDLVKTRVWLERENPTFVTIDFLHFFKNYNTVAIGGQGWGWDTTVPRIQKCYPNSLYTTHRPPCISSPEGIPNEKIKPMNLTATTGVKCFHYSYVTDRQVREKMAYYATEFPNIDRLKTWYQNVWKDWDIKKDIVELIYGTHPTAWRGSRTKPYIGPHPEAMGVKIHAPTMGNS